MGNHNQRGRERDWPIWMLVLSLSIITYYCTLLHAWGFQLDFFAEGDLGAFDDFRLALAVNLDRHGKEELQPTIPDVVWSRDKPLPPCWASEDEVLRLSVVDQTTCLGTASTAITGVHHNCMPNLQCPAPAGQQARTATSCLGNFAILALDWSAEAACHRHWPEVCDLCHNFLYVVRVKKHTIRVGVNETIITHFYFLMVSLTFEFWVNETIIIT